MIWSSVYFVPSKDSTPRLSNIQATEPGSPMLPPPLAMMWRMSAMVRFLLSVATSTSMATPPGAYPS